MAATARPSAMSNGDGVFDISTQQSISNLADGSSTETVSTFRISARGSDGKGAASTPTLLQKSVTTSTADGRSERSSHINGDGMDDRVTDHLLRVDGSTLTVTTENALARNHPLSPGQVRWLLDTGWQHAHGGAHGCIGQRRRTNHHH